MTTKQSLTDHVRIFIFINFDLSKNHAGCFFISMPSINELPFISHPVIYCISECAHMRVTESKQHVGELGENLHLMSCFCEGSSV